MSKYRSVHVLIEEGVYRKVWRIVASRFVNPSRSLSIVVNEALKEYVKRHERRRTKKRT